MTAVDLKRTPLYALHAAAGARLIDFGGWEMPVQFEGILAEHKTVREKAGVFDISHMGQVWVRGAGAAEFLQNLVTNDVSKLAPGRGQYALMCREDGGVVDDLYIYMLEPGRYLVIVNASRVPVDLMWMRDHLKPGAEILEQPQAAAIAIQGPQAEAILKGFSAEAAALPRNGVGEFPLEGLESVVARTGYTGEDGFEVFGAAGHVVPFYASLLKAGAARGLKPCGLGARDTLRLEMGYRLYGQDLDERHSALESGLGWAVKLEKPAFVGKEHLQREKAKGSARRFVALKLRERGVPRHGHAISFQGRPAGEVTSGTYSPSLQAGIAVGYVETRTCPEAAGSEGFSVRIHDRDVPADAVKLPFYRKDKI
jgi:aminomethyltransferase